MTAPAIDTAELVRLWKDPVARWEQDRESCPAHPAGEIVLKRGEPAGALRTAGPTGSWTVITFSTPSVSGPCLGLGPRADDRS